MVAAVAALLEILDVVALNPDMNFEVTGGFESYWRAHAWEGKYFKLLFESFRFIFKIEHRFHSHVILLNVATLMLKNRVTRLM